MTVVRSEDMRQLLLFVGTESELRSIIIGITHVHV